ncbi:MAG: MFS transporter, partial [Thermoleophilia bacterium]
MRDRAAARVVAVRARVLAHPRWRWMALMVVASGMMLSVVNVSIVNIALPEMAHDLGVDVPSISWVVTGFLVTQATLLAIAGRAGDLYGRRRIFVIGVVVLSLASVLCAVAPTLPLLVAARSLQAVGACAMAPTAFAYA